MNVVKLIFTGIALVTTGWALVCTMRLGHLDYDDRDAMLRRMARGFFAVGLWELSVGAVLIVMGGATAVTGAPALIVLGIFFLFASRCVGLLVP